MKEVFETLLNPETTEAQIKEILLQLSEHKITSDLLVEGAQVLRQHAIPVSLKVEAIDTAGTGGDQSGSFNFSTAAALLVAACGVPVAKHGNRSITSKSGSADLLEALGIPIDLSPKQVARSIEEKNFGFMLAPRYHAATKRVQMARKALKKVTVFNFLGPLVNPANVKRQLVGVFDNALRPVMAEALQKLGTKKAWVVWGEGGLDEMNLSGKTYVSEVSPQEITEKIVKPEDADLKQCDQEALRGGEANQNAETLQNIFSGKQSGPILDGILFNAAAALLVADQVRDLKTGVELAKRAIQNQNAETLIKKLKSQ